MSSKRTIFPNGIDSSGNYLIEPIESGKIAAALRSTSEDLFEDLNDPAKISWLRRVWQSISRPHLGLPIDVEPSDFKQAGWGIVFHENESDAVKTAMQPLIEHRRKEVTKGRVKILEYRAGDDRAKWLARNGVGAGTVDPEKVPYYLLIVGGPEQIPFSFCHELDVEYAVGLLHFDTIDEYDQYVKSIIAYESAKTVPNAKEAVFFGTRHKGDGATALSADYLVKPLAEGSIGSEPSQGVGEKWGFRSRKFWGNDATKAALTNAFTAPTFNGPPAFIFTASHGVGFSREDPRQRQLQGSLLCQDWPGIGSLNSNHYFQAQDLTNECYVHGLIAFCFACYGAGTPSHDRFSHLPGGQPRQIVDQPFLSALAKRLLSHPRGSALACIGHVERAWGFSIVTPDAGAQLLPFQNAIGRVLRGEPVGYAMKDFNEKYAALSTSLASVLEKISYGMKVSDEELESLWIERNDAEGYVVVGDPAIRIRVNDLK